MGFYFYPRGGSAHACHAIAAELMRNALDVTLLAGSRTDTGGRGCARKFFSGCDVRPVDFTQALRSGDPLGFEGGPGTAPMHASYEDRRGGEEPVMTKLGEHDFELQVAAWSAELERARVADADVLYIHHLSPLNEAAARVAPLTPVIGHVHGSELLMLEAIADGPPPGWDAAECWSERIRGWAEGCERIVVNSPSGMERAAALLEIEPERFALVPNGFKPSFAPRPADRAAHWRRHLVEDPQGWAPGEDPGSVAYEEADLPALGGTTLLSVGRFTEVKRLPLLIEAFANARPRFEGPTALVLLGGYPEEWEGEHPLETIERTGAEDVFLAGWHSHDELPSFLNAGDLLVHPSVMEQFGQVLVEAMACGRPAIAVDRGGPSDIVDPGETGWLIGPDDRGALEDAMVVAVNDRAQRQRIGRAARAEAVECYAWSQIGAQLAAIVRAATGHPVSPASPAKLPHAVDGQRKAISAFI